MLLLGIVMLACGLLALWLGKRGFIPLLATSYAAASAYAVVVAVTTLVGFGLTLVYLF